MNRPHSYLLEQLARVSFFLVNGMALYLLLRGHNQPGGGFIAGLASAASLLLLSLAQGVEVIPRILRWDPVWLAAGGLKLAVLTGVAPMLVGRPFLEHFHGHWRDVPLLGEVHAGTPLLFDLGVYLLVVGITCKLLLVLMRGVQGLQPLPPGEERYYSSPLESPIEGPAVSGASRQEGSSNAT